jgi:hypothetical protein
MREGRVDRELDSAALDSEKLLAAIQTPSMPRVSR